jgi:hypothetical protein
VGPASAASAQDLDDDPLAEWTQLYSESTDSSLGSGSTGAVVIGSDGSLYWGPTNGALAESGTTISRMVDARGELNHVAGSGRVDGGLDRCPEWDRGAQGEALWGVGRTRRIGGRGARGDREREDERGGSHAPMIPACATHVQCFRCAALAVAKGGVTGGIDPKRCPDMCGV